MGAVFACWLQVIVGGKSFWVFVCWNSFIHTVMYAYYCATTLGYRFRFKFMITILQLTQFVVGQSIGIYQYISYSHCYRSNDFWVWVLNSIYVWPLVAFFLHFYSQAYLPKKVKSVWFTLQETTCGHNGHIEQIYEEKLILMIQTDLCLLAVYLSFDVFVIGILRNHLWR